MAAQAEAAGWDGVFTWDGIDVGEMDTYDPWVVMAAMAMTTERVRLGAILTPPARRRPWKLARETVSVDRLSEGRFVLVVGLGATDDKGFGNVGEPIDARTRAERLDEALEILQGLWTGEPFAYQGRQYRFGTMTFRPRPVQQPRIPIWVAATLRSERSVARAVRYDGVLPQTDDPDEIRSLAGRPELEGRRFEIAVEGRTDPDEPRDRERVAELDAAGATWWVESDWDSWSVDTLRRRIAAGPPRPLLATVSRR